MVPLSALLGFCLLATLPARAQTPTLDATARIAKGDILHVEVIGRQDLSGDFTVEATGSVTLQLVGPVHAAGRSTTELAADLARRFSLVDRDILRVNVSLAGSQSRKIFVLGAVLRPGAYSFLDLPNVWDAIAEAGGATEDAELSAVEMIPGELRPDRAIKIVDVNAVLREGRLESLEHLRPGDTIRIPRALGAAAVGDSLVYVFGAVAVQSAHPITQAPDLLSAVIRSGGPTADADLKKVEIVRKNGDRVVHIRVDLRSYLASAAPSGNVTLQSRDTIYVPRSAGRPSRVFSALGTLAPLLALATSIAAFARR